MTNYRLECSAVGEGMHIELYCEECTDLAKLNELFCKPVDALEAMKLMKRYPNIGYVRKTLSSRTETTDWQIVKTTCEIIV